MEIMHAPSGFLHAARIVGLMTYPFYLLHEELGKVTRDVLQTWGLPIVPSVVCAILVSAGAALLIAQVAEPAVRDAMRYGLFKLSTGRSAGEWLHGRSSGKSERSVQLIKRSRLLGGGSSHTSSSIPASPPTRRRCWTAIRPAPCRSTSPP